MKIWWLLSKRIRKHKVGKKGLVVRSGFEARVIEDLTKRKIKFEYEKLKLKYTVPEKEHSYTPDLRLSNGMIIECKGIWTAQDRRKMVLVKEQHPELDIRMLFMRDQLLRKNAKTKYSDFCNRNGILWAEKEIPEEWLK